MSRFPARWSLLLLRLPGWEAVQAVAYGVAPDARLRRHVELRSNGRCGADGRLRRCRLCISARATLSILAGHWNGCWIWTWRLGAVRRRAERSKYRNWNMAYGGRWT